MIATMMFSSDSPLLLQLPITVAQHIVAWLAGTVQFLFYGMIGLRVLHFLIGAFRPAGAPYPSARDFFLRLEACFYKLRDLWSSTMTAAAAASSNEPRYRRIQRRQRHHSKPSPIQLYKKTELSQKHIDPIAMRRWKEVLAWIVFHPDELLLVDKRKQTALHHACLFRAPAQVIEMMLYQAPELAAMANVDDELPLHWAVRLSAPNEIIRWLLSVNPKSACEAKDKDGNTALSLVWERHDDTILDFWWSTVGVSRELNNHNGWKRILYFLQCHSYATAITALDESSSLLLPSQKQQQILHRRDSTSSSSSAATTPSIDDASEAMDRYAAAPSFLALHAATRSPCCPPSLYSLLLKMHHAQLQQADCQGRLPLAVACLDPTSNRSVGAMTKVHLLLAEYEAAAHVPNHLDSGRLPIFTALEAGLVWEEGIDRLIAVAPRSLLLRDPRTRFPAFLLAASASGKSIVSAQYKKRKSNEAFVFNRDARSLSTIYTLLRRDPTQLGALCPKSSLDEARLFTTPPAKVDALNETRM